MRVKANFSVFGRTLPSGKKVFYYQCYDGKGRRQYAKSTGLSKKTEAVAYCMKLYKDGLLIPEQKTPTFAEFSKGWWDIETCDYLKWRQLHDPIADTTLCIHQRNFKHHIFDYFKKFYLDEITSDIIEGWLLFMSKKQNMNGKDENKKTLKAKTVNLALETLRLMFGEAVRLKLLKDNPCREVKELRKEETERVILTVEEARKLFPADWSAVWDNLIVYKANRLAACTGVRIGELLGLRGEFVFDDYIFITGQITRFGYVPHTKTKENRNVPISPVMRQELEELLRVNGGGYVFSDDGGNSPVTADRIRRGFDRALERIGISHEEKLKRNLTVHSWRHFLNTLLRMSNVADSKVQKITGHRSMRMTEHYTHFDTRKFAEVRDVQTVLLTFKEAEIIEVMPAEETATKDKATA